MYDASSGTAVVVGWILAGTVAVLLVARALRTEARAGRDGVPGTRATAVRVLDVGLDAVLGVAVLALVASLAVVVVTAFAGPS